MKIRELKKLIGPAGGDFDIEIYFGHSTHKIDCVHIAKFGKVVAIHVAIDQPKNSSKKRV